MISTLFHAIFYDPIYNGLVFFIDIVPYGDVGLAIVLLTLFIRVILYPLFSSSIKTQTKVKQIEPEIKEIKEKHKNDKQTQAQKTMELYKKYKINPFAGILAVFIQLPVFISLYFIILRSGLPEIDPNLLYSFIEAPKEIGMNFLGLLDLTQKSMLLALTAGLSQFVHTKLTPLGASPKKKSNEKPNLKDDLARSMKLQMKYGLPIMITFIAYFISGAVALYWTTNNVLGIAQELWIRKGRKSEQQSEQQTQEKNEFRGNKKHN